MPTVTAYTPRRFCRTRSSTICLCLLPPQLRQAIISGISLLHHLRYSRANLRFLLVAHFLTKPYGERAVMYAELCGDLPQLYSGGFCFSANICGCGCRIVHVFYRASLTSVWFCGIISNVVIVVVIVGMILFCSCCCCYCFCCDNIITSIVSKVKWFLSKCFDSLVMHKVRSCFLTWLTEFLHGLNR